MDTLSPHDAANRLKANPIVGVKWRRFPHTEPIDLIGSVQAIREVDDDVQFTLVHGPDYETFHGMLVSRCQIAPVIDGVPAWGMAFTVPNLHDALDVDLDQALTQLNEDEGLSF